MITGAHVSNMITLRLSIIFIGISCSLLTVGAAGAITGNNTTIIPPYHPSTSNMLMQYNLPSAVIHPPSPLLATINVAFNKTTSSPILVSGTVYKQFSKPLFVKIQGPRGNLVQIAHVQPAPNGEFSLKFVPLAPLWSAQGNYTATLLSGSQTLGNATFHFNGTSITTPQTNIGNMASAAGPLILPGKSQEVATSGSHVYLLTTLASQNESGISFRTSQDGGNTFQDPAILANVSSIIHSRLYASGSDVYVIWSGLDNNGPELGLRHSSDYGKVFGDPVRINLANATGNAIVVGAQISSEGLKIIWFAPFGEHQILQIMLSQSHDGGKSFGNPVLLSDPAASPLFVYPVNSGNILYVAWFTAQGCQHVANPDCTKSYYLRAIGDPGLGKITPLANLSGYDFVSASGSDNKIFIEGIRHNYLNGTFENTSILVSSSNDGGRMFTQTSFDNADEIDDSTLVPAGTTLYQFWTESSKTGHGQLLFYAKSADGGRTFGKPVNLSVDSNLDFVNFHTMVAPYGNGVYLAWQGTDAVGGKHIFLDVIGPDSIKSSEIGNIGPAIGLVLNPTTSGVFITYDYSGHLFFEKVNNLGTQITDNDCNLDSHPSAGSVTVDTPEAWMDTDPDRLTYFQPFHADHSKLLMQMNEVQVSKILSGWKTGIRFDAKNVLNKDLNVVYHVNILKDGLVAWQASQNGMITCGQSDTRIFYWSPQNPGNYTIQASVSGENSVQLGSSNKTGISVGQNQDLQTFSSRPPMEFEVANNSQMRVNPGGFTTFPVVVTSSSENYRFGNTMLLIDSDRGIQAWFSKPMVQVSTQPQTLNVTVYADSGVTPGQHALQVEGQGSAINLVAGNPFTLGDPSNGFEAAVNHYDSYAHYLSQHHGFLNATLSITVLPSNQSLPHVLIGPVNDHLRTTCPSNELVMHHGCGTYDMYQEFPLRVYSPIPQNITLDATNYPSGAWLRFVPRVVHATPDGAPARMLLAGAVKTFVPNPISANMTRIEAVSPNGTGISYMQIEKSIPIRVINSTGPIDLEPIHIFGNYLYPYATKWVYNPVSGQNYTLPIKLSVLGVFDNNSKIQPLPRWLSVNIVNSSFTLDATQPYLVEMEVNVTSQTSGNATLAIQEDEGGKTYVGKAVVEVASLTVHNQALEQQLALARSKITHAVPVPTPVPLGWTSTVRD